MISRAMRPGDAGLIVCVKFTFRNYFEKECDFKMSNSVEYFPKRHNTEKKLSTFNF